jgi:hypothetical protein
MASAGAAAGTLAGNERLLRLTRGVDLIGAQGAFVARSAAGLTIGQTSSGVLLAILPLGYPAFALLFTVSGLTRLVLATRVEVAANWSSATAAFDVSELKRGRKE